MKYLWLRISQSILHLGTVLKNIDAIDITCSFDGALKYKFEQYQQNVIRNKITFRYD